MSGFVSAALGAVAPGLAATLFGAVRPASFRGVPFVVESSAGEGGRRLVNHEFPLRERPYNEDMGRATQHYRLRAFVLGEDYSDQRDALLAACQDSDKPGLLIHPYLGERLCRAGVLRWTESKAQGGYAAFDLEFIEEGKQASPRSVTDTGGGLLARLVKLLPLIKKAYAIISMAIKHPGYLLAFGANILGGVVESLLGLPPSTIDGLRLTIAGITGGYAVNDGVADPVLNTFQGAADNVIAAQAPSIVTPDPVLGSVPLPPRPADLTGGLLALTRYGADLPVIQPTTPVLANMAQQQRALVALVRAAACAAVIQVYASIEPPSADAAAVALAQVLDLADEQATAAADLGQDELYLGWQAVSSAAMQDLTERSQQLPRLARYELPGSLSSLALAQRLYADASRADQLVQLNNTPHPAFMPRAGFRLDT